jgi:tetratricopeptide (TPR) repeat protein
MLRPRTTSYTSRSLSILFLFAFPFLFAIFGFGQNPLNNEERQRGIELYNQQKYVAASDILKKAVEHNKKDDEGWSYLGLALLHQPKRIKEASKAFETALKLRPNSGIAHVGLGYSFLIRNKSSDAVREAQAALSIEPNIVDAHYIIGVARLRAGAQEEALQQAETAIKMDANFASAYLLKSQALAGSSGEDVVVVKEQESPDARKSRYAQAAEALENYLRLNPNAEEKHTWSDQLESLRFFGSSHTTGSGNDQVFSGKDVTTKARVLRKPEPRYTENARAAQITGTVVLRAVFAADGTVKHILVIKGLPYGLTEGSIKAARQITFIPATIDGRPVSTFIQLEYNFNLY